MQKEKPSFQVIPNWPDYTGVNLENAIAADQIPKFSALHHAPAPLPPHRPVLIIVPPMLLLGSDGAAGVCAPQKGTCPP